MGPDQADLEYRVRADFIKVLRTEYGRQHAPSGQLLDELWGVVEHHFGPILYPTVDTTDERIDQR